MMNIRLINGSPNRDNSTTLKLTKTFLDGMNETAEIINTIDLHINPCRACYDCWFTTNGHCVQKDDANSALEKIREADLVLWSIPLYCYGVPSHCKALMDRSLCFNQPDMYLDKNGIAHHYGYEDGSKKTVLISTGGLPNMVGNFDGLIFEFRHMFGQMTPAVCCAEGSLLTQKETAVLIRPYLDAVRKAGSEYKANGAIPARTQEILDAPILSPEAYIQNTNAIFRNLKEEHGKVEI